MTFIDPLPLYIDRRHRVPLLDHILQLAFVDLHSGCPCKKKKKNVNNKTTNIPKDEETVSLTFFVRLNKIKDDFARFRTKGVTKQQFWLNVVSILTVRKMMDPQNTILPNLCECRTSQSYVKQVRISQKKNYKVQIKIKL